MNDLIIKGRSFSSERSLYALKGATVDSCRFEGEEDGESVLKECRDVVVSGCFFDLRYPLWHAKGLEAKGCEFAGNARAPLWYCRGLSIRDSRLSCIKALRECEDASIDGSYIKSDEFGWKCRDIALRKSFLGSEYAFLDSKGILLEDVHFEGKYSFQYVEGLRIRRCSLHTKDAFWHSKDVIVEDSDVFGEYLGWFSEGLTLVRCRIKGTQPLCYCKGLRLIDCTMEDCDLSFEYSEADAVVRGNVPSIKNPGKGTIRVGSLGELIRGDAVHEADGQVIVDPALLGLPEVGREGA